MLPLVSGWVTTRDHSVKKPCHTINVLLTLSILPTLQANGLNHWWKKINNYHGFNFEFKIPIPTCLYFFFYRFIKSQLYILFFGTYHRKISVQIISDIIQRQYNLYIFFQNNFMGITLTELTFNLTN